MVHQDDEAMERMRAADPAIGSHPDLYTLHEKVSRRTPLGMASADPDAAVRVGDRTTTGSRASMVAAAAVVALGLGVGGYALGAQNTGSPEVRVIADGPETDDGSRDGASGILGSQPELLADIDVPSSGDMGFGFESADGYGGYGWFPVVLTPGPDLSTTGGTAEVSHAVTSDFDAGAFVTELASILGLEGDVEREGSMYAYLESGTTYVNAYAGARPGFDLYDSDREVYCEEFYDFEFDESLDEVSEGAVTAAPMPEMWSECDDDVEPVPDEQALAEVGEFLGSVEQLTGVDLSGVDLTVDSWEGSPMTAVVGESADEPGVWIYANVTAEGIASISVQLPVSYASMGDYPVVSPVEAVERMSDPRFQNWGQVYMPEVDRAYDSDFFWDFTEPEWPEVDTSPGAPIPFWITEATVVQATLGSGMLNLPDGSEFLVPAYHLVDDQGGHHTIIALTDDVLDFTP